MPMPPFAAGSTSGRVEFLRQPIEVVRIVVGALAVQRLVVVTRTAREERGSAVAGDRAVRNPVAIDVAIARELAELLEFVCIQPLAAIERLGRIVERLRHPGIHAQVKIGHHEDRRLESLGDFERVHRHRVALVDRGRQQHRVLGIAVRQYRG